MATKYNVFNGGTNGVDIAIGTVTNDGDAWQNVQIGTGATVKYSNAHPAHGTLGALIATSGTASQARLDWTFTAAGTIWFRLYMYTPASWLNTMTLVRFMSGSGANQVARIAFDGTGHLIVRDAANNAATGGTTTTGLSTSTMYRIEGKIVVGASSTDSELKIFSSIESATALETLTLSSANNFGAVNIDALFFGQVAALANVPSYYLDSIAYSTTAYPGAYARTGTGTGSNVSSVFGLITRSATAEGGSNGTTVTTGNSGGASGDAFNTVGIAATGAALTFANDAPTHGALSYKFAMTSTFKECRALWTLPPLGAIFFRFYLYLATGTTADLLIVQGNSGANTLGRVALVSSKLRLFDSSAIGQYTSTATIATNTPYRVEGYVIPGNSNTGGYGIKLFDSIESATPLESSTGSTNNMGAFPADRVQLGDASGGITTFLLDTIALSTAGYIGAANPPGGILAPRRPLRGLIVRGRR